MARILSLSIFLAVVGALESGDSNSRVEFAPPLAARRMQSVQGANQNHSSSGQQNSSQQPSSQGNETEEQHEEPAQQAQGQNSSAYPTQAPTEAPSSMPTDAPTETPTPMPTDAPTETRTPMPTDAPTTTTTTMPTHAPTAATTPMPTDAPTTTTTPMPTHAPTATTTPMPTHAPTATTTPTPTFPPTATATPMPSHAPTATTAPMRTHAPTATTTPIHTYAPTSPSMAPTQAPTDTLVYPTPPPAVVLTRPAPIYGTLLQVSTTAGFAVRGIIRLTTPSHCSTGYGTTLKTITSVGESSLFLNASLNETFPAGSIVENTNLFDPAPTPAPATKAEEFANTLAPPVFFKENRVAMTICVNQTNRQTTTNYEADLKNAFASFFGVDTSTITECRMSTEEVNAECAGSLAVVARYLAVNSGTKSSFCIGKPDLEGCLSRFKNDQQADGPTKFLGVLRGTSETPAIVARRLQNQDESQCASFWCSVKEVMVETIANRAVFKDYELNTWFALGLVSCILLVQAAPRVLAFARGQARETRRGIVIIPILVVTMLFYVIVQIVKTVRKQQAKIEPWGMISQLFLIGSALCFLLYVMLLWKRRSHRYEEIEKDATHPVLPLESVARRTKLMAPEYVRPMDGHNILELRGVAIFALLYTWFVTLSLFFFLSQASEERLAWLAWSPSKMIVEIIFATCPGPIVFDMVLSKAPCVAVYVAVGIMFILDLILWWLTFDACRAVNETDGWSFEDTIRLLDVALGEGLLTFLFGSFSWSMVIRFVSVYWYEPYYRHNLHRCVQLTSPEQIGDLSRGLQESDEVFVANHESVSDEWEPSAVQLANGSPVTLPEFDDGLESPKDRPEHRPCQSEPVFVQLQRRDAGKTSGKLVTVLDMVFGVQKPLPVRPVRREVWDEDTGETDEEDSCETEGDDEFDQARDLERTPAAPAVPEKWPLLSAQSPSSPPTATKQSPAHGGFVAQRVITESPYGRVQTPWFRVPAQPGAAT